MPDILTSIPADYYLLMLFLSFWLGLTYAIAKRLDEKGSDYAVPVFLNGLAIAFATIAFSIHI